MKSKMTIKNPFNPIATALLIIFTVVSWLLYELKIFDLYLSFAGTLFAIFIAASVKIADQWEKAVVLRMGKFIGLRGPGIFFIIPILDRIDSYIDQRVRVTDFKAEETLTKDTVPVNVDAVVYWTVWDVEKSALEVRNTLMLYITLRRLVCVI